MTIEDIERFKNSVIPTPITFFERFAFFILGGFAGGLLGIALSFLIAKLTGGIAIFITLAITVGLALLLAIISAIYPLKIRKFLLIFSFFNPSGPSN